MYLYTATEYSGDMIECEEGDLFWVDKDKILNLNLWEGDKIFLKKLLEDEEQPFELKLYYEGDRLVDQEITENPEKQD